MNDAPRLRGDRLSKRQATTRYATRAATKNGGDFDELLSVPSKRNSFFSPPDPPRKKRTRYSVTSPTTTTDIPIDDEVTIQPLEQKDGLVSATRANEEPAPVLVVPRVTWAELDEKVQQRLSVSAETAAPALVAFPPDASSAPDLKEAQFTLRGIQTATSSAVDLDFVPETPPCLEVQTVSEVPPELPLPEFDESLPLDLPLATSPSVDSGGHTLSPPLSPEEEEDEGIFRDLVLLPIIPASLLEQLIVPGEAS
jgi:hypothetical protein